MFVHVECCMIEPLLRIKGRAMSSKCTQNMADMVKGIRVSHNPTERRDVLTGGGHQTITLRGRWAVPLGRAEHGKKLSKH